MANDYDVQLTPTAESAYIRIYRDAEPHLRAGRNSHPKVKLLRIVDECLDKLIPSDPFSPKRALTGPLSSIFRIKKGRMRICYAGSSVDRTICVLYISETPRKEGDKNDPYKIFTNMVMSGVYDNVFEKLGVKRPQRRALPPITLQ